MLFLYERYTASSPQEVYKVINSLSLRPLSSDIRVVNTDSSTNDYKSDKSTSFMGGYDLTPSVNNFVWIESVEDEPVANIRLYGR